MYQENRKRCRRIREHQRVLPLTRHKSEGESVFDLLFRVAEIGGELGGEMELKSA